MFEGDAVADLLAAKDLIHNLIILTPRSSAAQLTCFFAQLNKNLFMHHADTLAGLDSLTQDIGGSSRLFAFGSPLVVPAAILARLRFGAYGVHPGPPCYPGWAPASFALYDGASIFGATAHVLTAKVDDGPIVGTELFAITPHMTPDHLATEATAAMGRLLLRLGKAIAAQAEPLAELPVGWGPHRGTRAKFSQMSAITADLDPAERARRLRAFGIAAFAYGVPLGDERAAIALK
jgi:methionyl-tRNA formyltransferase